MFIEQTFFRALSPMGRWIALAMGYRPVQGAALRNREARKQARLAKTRGVKLGVAGVAGRAQP